MNARAAGVLLVTLLAAIVTGCGGREGHPISATTPYDGQLDCAHLEAEKVVNSARAGDLVGEQHIDNANNLGFLLLSPLFLNFSTSEQMEIRAFAARESILNGLMAQRCAPPIPDAASPAAHT